MLTRRDFLRGLLSSVAAAALVKNGIAQPEQVIGVDCAEGKDRSVATVFDMAQNTWRQSAYHVSFDRADTAFRYGWREQGHGIPISQELLDDAAIDLSSWVGKLSVKWDTPPSRVNYVGRLEILVNEKWKQLVPETDDLGGYLILAKDLQGLRQRLEQSSVVRGHSIFVPLHDTTLEEVSRLRGIDVIGLNDVYPS